MAAVGTRHASGEKGCSRHELSSGRTDGGGADRYIDRQRIGLETRITDQNVQVSVDRFVFPDQSASVAPLLAVSELARSLRFWVDQVGGAIQVQWDTYALVKIGCGRLHLAVTGDPPPDRSIRFVPPIRADKQASGEVVIEVLDCRPVVTALQERGVRFLGPVAEPAWGGEVRAFALDPDGHLLEITSPTQPVPEGR